MKLITSVAVTLIFLANVGHADDVGQNVGEDYNPQPEALALDFSRDGSIVVTGGDAVRVHDIISGEKLCDIASVRTIRAVPFSPRENRVFTAVGDDGTIRFWRVPEKKPFRVLVRDSAMATALVFSPDGNLLASGTWGEYINGKLVPDMTASGDFTLWNTETGNTVRTLTFPGFHVGCVAFSRDGKLVAFAKNSTDKDVSSNVDVYDVEPWKHIRSIAFSPGFANAISFMRDGREILIAGGVCVPINPKSCRVIGKLWSARPDAPEATELVDPVPYEYFREASLTADGDRFVTGTMKLTPRPGGGATSAPEVQMRETKTGRLIWSLVGKGNGVYGAKISPDGKLVGCCIGSKLLIVDSATGDLVRSIALGE